MQWLGSKILCVLVEVVGCIMQLANLFLGNALLDLSIVHATGADDVIIVLAPAGVHIGVAYLFQ